MHIEFLLEEPSAEAALNSILPRILPKEITYTHHPFNGKSDLLSNLSKRLKAYGKWITNDYSIVIVVLIDEDRQDCHKLKEQLEGTAREAKLIAKSSAKGKNKFHIVNRIAVEELEAWFFGDIEAVCQAYPRVPNTIINRAKYRNPDKISGGTWESLEGILKTAGYYTTGLPKIEVARKISQFMKPERNKSKSFQIFLQGIKAVIDQT